MINIRESGPSLISTAWLSVKRNLALTRWDFASSWHLHKYAKIIGCNLFSFFAVKNIVVPKKAFTSRSKFYPVFFYCNTISCSSFLMSANFWLCRWWWTQLRICVNRLFHWMIRYAVCWSRCRFITQGHMNLWIIRTQELTMSEEYIKVKMKFARHELSDTTRVASIIKTT